MLHWSLPAMAASHEEIRQKVCLILRITGSEALHITSHLFLLDQVMTLTMKLYLQMLKKIAFHLKLKILKLQTHVLEKSKKGKTQSLVNTNMQSGFLKTKIKPNKIR